ncbi:RNA methyltransferase [Olivibacter sp. SDN3]|uniref:TrmH family RNA methyltransferase n=1 Tax=Olivibacter sp. SDN3 TaxID=2764720 RepID=UPI00165126B7|nr:RNA methyltransferase [Olivibacter sp. SDN3]QNL48471.1 RNA methyltransferase [Olivibacter sp. SDN3]
MLPKSQLQFIKSLHHKKFRKEHGLFIVEGIKSITEFLQSDYTVHHIFHSSNLGPKIDIFLKNVKLNTITERELAAISTVKTPQGILALVEIPSDEPINYNQLSGNFTLVLDTIQDPGNMGTIIRTADWFGIHKIICSENTVDIFNPKVVQATMGSLAHVSVVYTNLTSFLSNINVPVYATLLTGQSIYKTDFGNEGVILLGNEGSGINQNLLPNNTIGITIPRYGSAESLNVALSTAICCSEIRRRE